MDYGSYPTILEVIYIVLQNSDWPLAPEEIELAAAGYGYDITAQEAFDEIETHLEAYGNESPFIPVGMREYWIAGEPVQYEPPPQNPSSFLKSLAALALVVAVSFAWMFYSGMKPSISAPQAGGPVEAVAAAVDQAGISSVKLAPVSADLTWWVENAVNQINTETQSVSRDLLANYYNTCGPAVISMVVSYYRAQSGEGDRVSPADVLTDARAQLGYFLPPYNSGLLDFHNLDDLAGYYGLERIYPQGRSVLMTTAELLDGVRQGRPAIAGMRFGYNDDRYLPRGGSGVYNHFVVVIGTQDVDGQEKLLVLNNHPGIYLLKDEDVQPEPMDLDQFEQSWLLNDGSEREDYGYGAFYQPVQ
jgi:hypothetical protein